MRKQILMITCCLVFSGFCRAEDGKSTDEPPMEKLIDSISDLAERVLDTFEPIVKSSSKNETADDAPNHTYFVSFLLRGSKNKTDITPKKRMVVNNNFSGERMGTNQVFLESGPSVKQPASHNVQLLNNPSMQTPNHPSQSYQPQAHQPYLKPQQKLQHNFF